MRPLPFYLLFFLIAWSPRPQQVTPMESDFLGEAFEFFVADSDFEAVNTLSGRILEKYPDDVALSNLVLDYSLRRRDRKLLHANFLAFWRRNQCPPLNSEAGLKGSCLSLFRVWNNNLKTVNFFEDTVVKLQKAKKLIQSNNCVDALPVLKEVEAKEGSLEPLLNLYREAYICLKDTEAAKAVNLRIERLRILENES